MDICKVLKKKSHILIKLRIVNLQPRRHEKVNNQLSTYWLKLLSVNLQKLLIKMD